MDQMLMDLEKTMFREQLGGIINASISLAAFCVCLSMIGIGVQYLRGGQFDIMQFARPLVIFIFVANFSGFVLGPLRSATGIFNAKLSEWTGDSISDFKGIYKDEMERVKDSNIASLDSKQWIDTYEEEEETFIGKAKTFLNKTVSGFFKLNEIAYSSVAGAICGLLYFLMNIFVSIMTITSRLFLILMGLIGPYTFALAIMPSFSNGIKLWVERYIQYTLWQPLLYIVMFIAANVLAMSASFTGDAITGPFWTWVFLILAIFALIKSVPTIASHIIEGQGTEQLANAVSGSGGQALQKASSAAMIIK